MLNSAATGELNSLSEAERDTFREGLRQDLGDAGFEQFFEEMFKREMASKGTEDLIRNFSLGLVSWISTRSLVVSHTWGFDVEHITHLNHRHPPHPHRTIVHADYAPARGTNRSSRTVESVGVCGVQEPRDSRPRGVGEM